MWLDADDVILQEDQEQLVELKQRLQPEVSIVMMKYHTAFDDKGNPTFSYYRERLMNRRMQHRWSGVIHEVIPLTGMVQYEDIAITHQKLHINDPDRNLRIFEKLLAQGKQLDAREQFITQGSCTITHVTMMLCRCLKPFWTESRDGWKTTLMRVK